MRTPLLPSSRRPLFALVLVGAGACSSPPLEAPDAAAPDAGVPVDSAPALPPECAGAALPPATLVCTGLYADLATKQIAAGVRPYAPAVPLWSDGADKARFISLPPGSTIDARDPTEWVFPVGTKLWKEFSVGGHRIETRLWQKVRDGYWVNAAYAWNADESAATRTGGGDIPLNGGTYHIPTNDECEKCHRGRNEHILGFEAVELGLPGATGVTLAVLAAENLLSPPPAATALSLGDDGTGAAGPALGWLHANCGITCHNGNSSAIAYAAGMRLRLDPRDLDGRSSADLPPVKTTVGVSVHAVNWNGRTRILPGDPENSLLYDLISHRGMGRQMPPFATRVVDEEHVALVAAWIRALPPLPDAGVPDASVPDAAVPDAMEPDVVSPADGPELDAAAPVDAPEADAGATLDAAPADAVEDAGDTDVASEPDTADAPSAADGSF